MIVPILLVNAGKCSRDKHLVHDVVQVQVFSIIAKIDWLIIMVVESKQTKNEIRLNLWEQFISNLFVQKAKINDLQFQLKF